MTKFSKILLFVLFAIAAAFANDAVDSFFADITNYKEFACSVEVVQYSQLDTAIDNGFVAWKGENFFAHLGDDYFLQSDSGEFLTWSEGGDAMPAENEFVFGNFSEMREKLMKKYSLLANVASDRKKLIGAAKNDENPIAKFLIILDGKNKLIKISLWDRTNIKTDILFDRPLKKMPGNSIFVLPKGIGVVR